MAVTGKTYLKIDPQSLTSAKISRTVKLKSAYLGIKDECPEAYFHSPVNYVMLRTLTRTDYHLQKVTWSKIIMSVPSSAVK